LTGKAATQKSLETDIRGYCKDNWEELSKPLEAYIIFSNEESYQRAVKIKVLKVCWWTDSSMDWKGTELQFGNAQEPSNIIWENLW